MMQARYLPAVASIALSAVLVAGCASTRVDAQWTDPQFAGHSLRGAHVLVVCTAGEVAIERICEQELRAQVSASGAVPVAARATDKLTAGPGTADAQTLAVARDLGASAVLTAAVAPDAAYFSSAPTVGIGVGGGSWGSGSSVGVGVGVSVPVGGTGVDRAYGANIVLTDVGTGRLMWTSKVTTRASRDVQAQIGALTKAGFAAAHSAGLF